MNPWIWFAILLGMAALLLLWPKRGLLARWRNEKRTSERIQVEDVLKHLYNYELETRRPTLASIAGRVHITENEAAALVETMQARGLVQWHNEQLALSPDGRAYALHIVRAHRLWERYLADETGYDETRWHAAGGRVRAFAHARGDCSTGQPFGPAPGRPSRRPHSQRAGRAANICPAKA